MYLPATVKSHARLRIVEAELDFHSLSSFSSCLSILSFVTYCCNVVAHLITAENFSPWRSSLLVILLSRLFFHLINVLFSRTTIVSSTAPSLNIHFCWQSILWVRISLLFAVSHAAIRSTLCGSLQDLCTTLQQWMFWPRHTLTQLSRCWVKLLDQPSCTMACPQSAVLAGLLCRSLPSPKTAYAYTYRSHPSI